MLVVALFALCFWFCKKACRPGHLLELLPVLLSSLCRALVFWFAQFVVKFAQKVVRGYQFRTSVALVNNGFFGY